MLVLLGLLVTSGFTQFSYGHSISIIDSPTAFPFLRSVDNPSTAMSWDSGTVIQLLSNCKLIRVTRRGVRCIDSTNNLIEGWQNAFTPAVSCIPTNSALCVTAKENRFFPTDVVFVSDESVTACVHGQGRKLVSTKQTSVANKTSNYVKNDISLCDVLDTNLDVIYDPVNNYIYEKQLTSSGGLYTFISLLVLTVVVLTAETLSQRSRSKLIHNIVAWTVLTATTLLMLGQVDGRMHPFVTREDRSFIFTSLVYIILSTTFWVYSIAKTRSLAVSTAGITGSNTDANSPETQRDGVNAMVGSIHFATCVLYGTPDNAYVTGFFFVFLFRCLEKLYDAHHRPDQWTPLANTIIMLDIIYTVTIFSFGVLPHFTNDSDTVLYAAAQFVICDTIASTCTTSKSTAIDSPAVKSPSVERPPAVNPAALAWMQPPIEAT